MTTSVATSHRLTVGDRAPVFALPDTSGDPVRLEPGEHAATVVVFTSNGCPFALAWHDRLQQVARDYAGRDVLVLQVVSNDPTDRPEDSVDAMAARVADGELAGPFLHDADQSVAQAYGATATPEVFVIDRDGVVRYHGAPDGDHDDPAQDAGGSATRSTRSLAGPTSPARPRPRRAARSSGVWNCCGGRAALRTSRPPTSCEPPWTSCAAATCTWSQREVVTRDDAAALGFPGRRPSRSAVATCSRSTPHQR